MERLKNHTYISDAFTDEILAKIKPFLCRFDGYKEIL